MKKIIGTGLSGLVGSRVVELLCASYEFEDMSRKTGIDITSASAVLDRLKNVTTEYVIHMAAYTNVDGAEEEKEKDMKILRYKDIEKQQVEFSSYQSPWCINVVGTENVVKAAEATEKKLLYISTDFVFDGENTPAGGYTEEDMPHPVNWYATTKHEAELRVQEAKIPWTIVRIAYPYRAIFEKNDFFRAIKQRLSQGQQIAGITDHLFCPTFIDDIAVVVDTLMRQNMTGIYHAAGGQVLSPYDSAIAIADTFGLDKTLINKTTRAEYFQNKALRPFNLTMNNGKIKTLGVTMKGFQEGLEEIKAQISDVTSASKI